MFQSKRQWIEPVTELNGLEGPFASEPLTSIDLCVVCGRPFHNIFPPCNSGGSNIPVNKADISSYIA